MRMRNRARILVVLGVLGAIIAVQTVLAHEPKGCTPGFWKNLRKHEEFWVGYDPDQTVGSVFSEPLYGLGGDTLHQALQYGGGPGAEGAAKILLRAAVAALLNSAYAYSDPADWGWGAWPEDVIVAEVNSALDSGDRDLMLMKAGDFDWLNNQGCPLPPE